ncbi:hypothetical protein GSI_05803 [Ganoderma sinense ZZ0214-1]|uniref:F-box domain-containing protein n=1 Tax=Ganoderma sinense ZZ0214-1 TaxID=1077348 RepID=A0A2G8SBG7_9APHY|nr:hypothetical protein GSI_05803 [Ganoderma sinense ZZ0214-1]
MRLSTEESIDGFYRFIFAKEAARAPYIYGLKLPDPENLYGSDFGPSDPQFRTLNDRLVTILQAAIHLEYIFFPITDNLDPVLTIAAKMTSLCELSIYLIYDSPWEFLSTFRSSLHSLDIREGDIDDSESVSAGRLHNHLANFAPTLEVLKLQYFNNFDIMPSFMTTQFTAVRSLTISNVILFDHLTMEILLRLFPGLDRTLDLDTLQPTHGEDVYLDWREVNKDVQKTRAWPRLDRVVCEAEGVFLMALQCPIRHMETRVPCDQKRYLAPALRHNYPQRLHCVVTFVDGLDDLDGELFPSEGAERLTHLSMVARLEVGWPPKFRLTQIPWPQFRDKMIASLSHLRRLTHLRLVFHYDVFQHDPESDPTLLYATDEADLQLAATELARTIPTLQYVF